MVPVKKSAKVNYEKSSKKISKISKALFVTVMRSHTPILKLNSQAVKCVKRLKIGTKWPKVFLNQAASMERGIIWKNAKEPVISVPLTSRYFNLPLKTQMLIETFKMCIPRLTGTQRETSSTEWFEVVVRSCHLKNVTKESQMFFNSKTVSLDVTQPRTETVATVT